MNRKCFFLIVVALAVSALPARVVGKTGKRVPVIRSVQSKSAGTVRVKFKKVKGAKKYQIVIAANNKFTKNVTKCN